MLGLSRSSLYYEPGGEAAEDLRLMRLIDEQYTACPFYGSRRMTAWLVERGEGVEPEVGVTADADHGPGGDPSRAPADRLSDNFFLCFPVFERHGLLRLIGFQ